MRYLSRSVLVTSVALVLATVTVDAAPLRVYILAGQSNMQGHAKVATFGAMALDAETAPLLKAMSDTGGTPRTCERVWISSLGSADRVRTGPLTVGFGAQRGGPKIGPEFTFGLTMEKHLGEPILIIKTAWGGKSLHTDFRPPSAGPFVFNDSQLANFTRQGKDIEAIRAEKVEATGKNYRLMIDHVRGVLGDIGSVVPGYDAAAGYELAGFVWFQGWNDMVGGDVYPRRDKPGGYDAYSDVLRHFIRDVRRDLDAPGLPFVIGVMGVGGPTDEYGPDQQRYRSTHQNFRDAMAAPAGDAEFAGNVVAVRTEMFWDMEVAALRARDRALKPEKDAITAAVKAGTMARADGDAAIEALYAEAFNERELRLLRESVSNAEYHYLGSARILGPIGEAFADALIDMESGEDS